MAHAQRIRSLYCGQDAGSAESVILPLDAGSGRLRVAVEGVAQLLTLPTGSVPWDGVVEAINRGLRGGYARLSDAGDGGPRG